MHFQSKQLLITLFIFLLSRIFFAQTVSQEFPHYDDTKSFEERIEGLLKEMSVEEKISQLEHDAKAIPRLGIPKYNWWNESLHGVAFSGRATVFPQPIGLGASFNPELLYKIAEATSDEARAKHHEYIRQDKRSIFQGLTFFAPNINIFRDPRWGRGSETYGEDPYLTGRLGVSFIKGLQGDDPKYLKLVATPKHYAVHSGPEANRHSFNSMANDKDLYETYLPHFKEAIQEGKAFSIMSAYNRLNGASASGHERLLTKILREDWGFEGFVVSDCGAIKDIYENHKIAYSESNAAAIGLTSGCDLNCGQYYKHLNDAYAEGQVSEEYIDRALRRLLLARFKLGMFDPDDKVPYTSIPQSVVNSKEHQELALQAARESIVLLKNDNNILPLTRKIKTIGVIGPNANELEALWGNYHGLPFQYVTPINGIRKKAPKSTKILYAPGSDLKKGLYLMENLPSRFLNTTKDGKSVPGLTGEYFANDSLAGSPKHVRIDPDIRFDWSEGKTFDDMPDDFFSIRWTGELTVDKSGEYIIGAEGHNGFKVFIDDSLHVKHHEGYHENVKHYKPITMEAGKSKKIRIEFDAQTGSANFRLLWVPFERNLTRDALEIAEKSDVVVMCMGITPRLEAEGSDRTSIDLPQVQQDLIKTIQKTGKPIVLVLMNGSQFAINWEKKNIPAIVEAWYPGQAGGEAIADVLFGNYNPSGRLPLTFYNSLDELPHFGNYAMQGRTYRYYENEPIYPFGYGMSYTSFSYGKPEIKSNGIQNPVEVKVKVTNSGKKSGHEVVQLYIKNNQLGKGQPKYSLKGIEKIFLKFGKSEEVTFTLPPERFAYYNNKGETVLESGEFTIYVGGGQPELSASTTQVVSKAIKL